MPLRIKIPVRRARGGTNWDVLELRDNLAQRCGRRVKRDIRYLGNSAAQILIVQGDEGHMEVACEDERTLAKIACPIAMPTVPPSVLALKSSMQNRSPEVKRRERTE